MTQLSCPLQFSPLPPNLTGSRATWTPKLGEFDYGRRESDPGEPVERDSGAIPGEEVEGDREVETVDCGSL